MGKYSENSYENLETGAVSAHNPRAIPLSYTDPTGAKQIGYAIDNRMYKDEAGLQRIDNGSIVTNAAGTQSWVMTDAGGVEYGEYQRQQALAAQPGNQLANAKKAAMTAANQRLEADIAAIEQNKPKINARYDDLARQNYLGYLQSGRALANSLASQGLYNSGYSDTAKIAQMTNYRAQAAANERARLESLADLDDQINLARRNGSANLNELEAQYAQLLNEQANADREFAYRQNRDNIEDMRYQTEWGYRLEQDELAQQNWQKEFDMAHEQILWEQQMYEENALTEAERRTIADAYAAAEIGDFSKLRALGIDTANAEKLYALELQGMYRTVQNRDDGNGNIKGGETIGSTFGGSDVSTAYDELYKHNKNAYYQMIAYARSFAENQYTEPESSILQQVNSYAELLNNKYGAGFGDLYKQVALENIAEYRAVIVEEADLRVREVLYDANGVRIRDKDRLKQLLIELNAMDIPNEDLKRLILRYDLGALWNELTQTGEDDANHR